MGTRAERLWDKSERHCVVCGDAYMPVRNIQKYCPLPKRCRYSNKARIMSRRQEIVVLKCTECGKDFVPRASDQYTCGMRCPGKPPLVKRCANAFCNKKFTVTRQVSPGRQIYCSSQCNQKEDVFRKYKTTSKDYLKMLDAQNGVCLGCGYPPEGDVRLVVDHSHECCPGQRTCGKCIRGLFHADCNIVEGMFQADLDRLVNLALFLKKRSMTLDPKYDWSF